MPWRRRERFGLILWNLASRAAVLLGELEEDAGRRFWMDEGDTATPGSDPRRLVNQPVARRAAGSECGVKVRNTVADVVDSGPAPGEKPGDRTVRVFWCQQLHVRFAKWEADDRRAVGAFGPVRREAQHITVEGEGRIEIVDGHPYMGNPGVISHGLPRGERVDMRQTATENNAMNATNTVHVSDANFAGEIEQASGLVLVDFWATWCGPCQVVAPVLDQLAGEYAGRAKIAKLDVDSNQRTAMRFNVRSIPSILFFKDGRHVDTVVGAVPKTTLDAKIKQHL
jgi:thioredoxin 1